MANTKSAIKRMRQSEKRRLRNRAVRSKVRTTLKTARSAVATKAQTAQTSVSDAVRALDKAVAKGVLHGNTAARKKSRLVKQLAASLG
jgi:small subunit ribosomal protein S20